LVFDIRGPSWRMREHHALATETAEHAERDIP
jgi:hypothetical protein